MAICKHVKFFPMQIIKNDCLNIFIVFPTIPMFKCPHPPPRPFRPLSSLLGPIPSGVDTRLCTTDISALADSWSVSPSNEANSSGWVFPWGLSERIRDLRDQASLWCTWRLASTPNGPSATRMSWVLACISCELLLSGASQTVPLTRRVLFSFRPLHEIWNKGAWDRGSVFSESIYWFKLLRNLGSWSSISPRQMVWGLL